MTRKKVVLNIAGILLQLEEERRAHLTDIFRRFIEVPKKAKSRIWHFESIEVDKKKVRIKKNRKINKKILNIKKRFGGIKGLNKDWHKKKNFYSFNLPNYYPLSNLSFYFNDPTFINTKKRRITHFYPVRNFASNGVYLTKTKESYRKYFDSRLITYVYSQLLALNRGLLLHALAVIKDKKAYLFFGVSGGGKSTIAELCKHYKVLGDDVIAIKKNVEGYDAFSTPWQGGLFIKSNKYISARIKAVFFLKKSKKISFRPIRPEEALVRVLSCHIHFFTYTESPLIEKIFFTTADFIKGVPAYEMEFRKDKDFWPKLDKVLGLRC